MICGQLLEILQRGNLVQVMPPTHGRPGYQLKASAMRWCAGDGTRAFQDPLRIPNLPEGGGRANPFFGRVYRAVRGSQVSVLLTLVQDRKKLAELRVEGTADDVPGLAAKLVDAVFRSAEANGNPQK